MIWMAVLLIKVTYSVVLDVNLSVKLTVINCEKLILSKQFSVSCYPHFQMI